MSAMGTGATDGASNTLLRKNERGTAGVVGAPDVVSAMEKNGGSTSVEDAEDDAAVDVAVISPQLGCSIIYSRQLFFVDLTRPSSLSQRPPAARRCRRCATHSDRHIACLLVVAAACHSRCRTAWPAATCRTVPVPVPMPWARRLHHRARVDGTERQIQRQPPRSARAPPRCQQCRQ